MSGGVFDETGPETDPAKVEGDTSFFNEVQRKLDVGEALTAEETEAAQRMGLAPRKTTFPVPDPLPPSEQPPQPEPEAAAPEEEKKPEYVDPFEALKQLSPEERLERLERELHAFKVQWLAVLAELGRATGREDAINKILTPPEKPAPPAE